MSVNTIKLVLAIWKRVLFYSNKSKNRYIISVPLTAAAAFPPMFMDQLPAGSRQCWLSPVAAPASSTVTSAWSSPTLLSPFVAAATPSSSSLPDYDTFPVVSPPSLEPLKLPAPPPLVHWILNVPIAIVIPYPSLVGIIVVIEDNVVAILCGCDSHVLSIA